VYFLTDPVFEQRASPLSFAGPKRYYDPCCQIEDIPVDVILLSHTHYDHLDMPTVKKIGNKAHW
jgi:L-ascorbate metabolism protein UlaG (beta-lactamase superfamily)